MASKYRSNLTFSLFVALAVAAAVGVVLFLNGNGGNDAPDPQAEGPPQAQAAPQPHLSCQFEGPEGEVRIVFDPVDGDCAEARRIYETYREMARSGETEGYEPARVETWTCREFPLAEFPLLARCGQGARRFEVLGLAPSAHLGEEAY